MSKTKYRAQILLESEQHTALSEIAHRQGRSISDLTREIVAQYLVQLDETLRHQLDHIERIKQHRAEMIARRGGRHPEIDVTALIEAAREERGNELFTNTFGDRR
jgi:hypothetical protein